MIDRSCGLPRWFEASAALLALVVASPLLLAAAVGVATTSRGPVMYRQVRVGRSRKAFVLYKFRTMRVGAQGPQVTATGDSRVTTVGRFLRKTKLDELPELWNVVKGDMSLVGPRPEVPRHVEATDLWCEVLAVRPGVTDPVTLVLRNEEDLLAGVDGDTETFYRTVLQPYKLLYYSKYLRQRSAWTDLKILSATIYAIVFPRTAPVPSQDDILAWTRMQDPSMSDSMKSAKSSC